MNSIFLKYPMLPPLIGYIAGILIAEHLGYEWIFILLISPILGLLSLLWEDLRFLLFIPLGVLFSISLTLPENHIANFVGNEIDLWGTLYRSPESRIEGSRLFVDVEEIVVKGKKESATGKVIINTKQRIRGLSRGDNVRVIDTILKPYRTFKNPGNFDIKRYYERQKIYAYGFVSGMDSIILFEPKLTPFYFLRVIDMARTRFGYFVKHRFPQSEGEILNAITVGDKGGMPNRLKDTFSEAGIAHLLAISGLHVGGIALAFYLAIKWLLKRSEYFLIRLQVPRVTAGLAIIPLFIYMAVAGFATPVVRAFLMIAVYLMSVVLGKEENKLNTLGASAFIILLWQPWALFQLSFQLSFAAVLGIIFVNKFYPSKFGSFSEKIISSAKITMGASFATIPLIVNSFGILSLISLPANLIFVPLVEFLIVPLGLISFLLFSVNEYLAVPFLSLNVYLIRILIFGIEKLVEIPFSSLTVTSLGITGWLLYILIILVICFKKVFPNLKYILPLFILGLIMAMTISTVSGSSSGYLELDFLDISNRNVAFVRLPQKKTILFDGGYSLFDRGGYMERSVISPFLLNADIKTIDYLILTTLDKDHLEGVKYLLQKFEVKRLWTNGAKLDGELWYLVRRKNIDWKNIMDEVENFEVEGVRIEFYKPRGYYEITDSSRSYPLILNLTFGKIDFLLGESLGDPSVQRELMDIYHNRIQPKVVYVPALKRNSEVTNNFLNTFSPDILIVNDTLGSIGKFYESGDSNLSNHKKSKLIETRKEGTVAISTNGIDLRVRTFTNADLL
ncbi:MAG: DNA internalization-related competence protein ComEC/Rec2 [Thermodesulfobacteriota bacterium]